MILTVLSGADHPGSLTRQAALDITHSLAGHAASDEATVVGHILDLAKHPVPLVDGNPDNWPGVNPTWAQYVIDADEIVIAAPVYNFGIPAALKAWIDQIVIAGRTFDPETYTGLLPKGKHVEIVVASGGNDPFETPSHVPYLTSIFRLLGVESITVTTVKPGGETTTTTDEPTTA